MPFNFEAIQREHASRSHLPINLNLPPISTPPSVSIENRKNLETSKTSEDDSSSKSKRKPTVARVGGNLQILANFTQYCPPSHARTLFWNWTKAVSFLSLILIYIAFFLSPFLYYCLSLSLSLSVSHFLFFSLSFILLFVYQ